MLIDILLKIAAIAGTSTLNDRPLETSLLAKIPFVIGPADQPVEKFSGFISATGKTLNFTPWLSELKKAGTSRLFYAESLYAAPMAGSKTAPAENPIIGALYATSDGRTFTKYALNVKLISNTSTASVAAVPGNFSIRIASDWAHQRAALKKAVDDFFAFANTFNIQPFKRQYGRVRALLNGDSSNINNKIATALKEATSQEDFPSDLYFVIPMAEMEYNLLRSAGMPDEIVHLNALADWATPSGIGGMGGYFDAGRPAEEYAAFEPVYKPLRVACS